VAPPGGLPVCWTLPWPTATATATSSPQLPGVPPSLSAVSQLLQRLGRADSHGVAEALLALLGAQVALAQCAIFSFEGQGRPRIVAVGDRRRTRALPEISRRYVTEFYRLDGIGPVMAAHTAAARSAPPDQPLIVLHRQRGADVAHADYRALCYDTPRVAERLALLSLVEGQRWLSVHLYRGCEHGPFDAGALAVVQAYAPLVVDAVRLHYTRERLNDDLDGLLLARLQRRCPGLTKRDIDVVRALMAGLSTLALAERLGLTLSSAQTYLKRICRKLGVAGRRELLACLLAPENTALPPPAA
jgi:DNA-binding CsgD family transcriptional regulator